ncbi:MAG: hypothetical protein ABIT36_09440 [Steroidobacteraceae bacterium]
MSTAKTTTLTCLLGGLGALLAGCANTVVTTDAQQAQRATQAPPVPTPSAPPSAVNPSGPPRVPLPAPERGALTATTVTVDTLLDDPRGRDVLARHAPALSSQLSKFRGKSLAQIAGNPEAGLTPALVEKIVAELNAQ